MNNDDIHPQLPINPPPISKYGHGDSETPKKIRFSLSSTPLTTPELPSPNTYSEFAVIHESSTSNWFDDTRQGDIESTNRFSGISIPEAPSLPPLYSPYSTPPTFSTSYLRFSGQDTDSWKYNEHDRKIEPKRYQMMVGEAPGGLTGHSDGQRSLYQSATSRSIANSLDSLSECAQNTCEMLPGHVDRSQSLGDLIMETSRGIDSIKNGSFDGLTSKGLTDSGISGGLVNDDFNLDHSHMGMISSPDAYSCQSVSFSPYDPGSFANENLNPLESGSRIQIEDRKLSELPVISEESDHEQNVSFSNQSSVDKGEVVELSYPMTHCNSEPTNAYSKTATSKNFEHRRVVSDDVSEVTMLKRSNEMENVDKIGNFEYDSKSNNLKKGRCKSLMLVVQGSGEDELSSEEDEVIVGESKDNDMLIIPKNHEISTRKSNLEQGSSHSSEPPPVRLSRKVSASSTRSTPVKAASEQSWKEKMPPFAMSSHMMYTPQSLPSRDSHPRAPFDGSGTVTGGTQSPHLSPVFATECETTDPDGGIRIERCFVSPPSLLSELSDELLPLSSIFRRTISISSTATETCSKSPQSSSPTNNNNSNNINSNNNSFVRRSLRKIMKRGSASTSALNEQYDGPRTNSLKRRASAASSSLIASAQAHLRPRAKSLKKQRLSKPNKKEKTGSDTFTFGNLFRKKQQTPRANLHDIISDLDQRSGQKYNSFGGQARRCTSASIINSQTESGVYETSSLDEFIARILEGMENCNVMTSPFWQTIEERNEEEHIDFIDAENENIEVKSLPDHISRMVSPTDSSDTFSNSVTPNSLHLQLDRLWGKYDLFTSDEYQSWHEKYRSNTLSTKQVKKQDAIFELYMMEKRHCASIAFLLQGYRRRMIDENIISRQDMDILIPDVLEPLLIFHLNVLERMTERIKENNEVSTISDIICDELDTEGGRHTKLCCDAYTDFGAAKEKSDNLYHHLMSKNSRFSEFLRKSYNEEPLYKQFEFRPLVTKIIGRPTKYSLLLETILKNEQQFSEYHDLTIKALETARRFAHKIDENLSMAHMSSKWDEIKAQVDPSSQTSLYVPDPLIQHSLHRHKIDMDALNAVTSRKLVHIGEVFIKQPSIPNGTHSSSSSSSAKTDKLPATLVLFDDIIVILCRKGSRLHFMQEQGALPLKSLLTRTSARGHSIMIISGGKPVLYEISFHTSADRKKWVSYLEAAPKNVPIEGVRLSQSNEEEMLRRKSAKQMECEDIWLEKLNQMFLARCAEEEALSNYLESRLKFFDEVRVHMSQMPFKSRHDISDRIREAVRGRFRELRRARVYPLSKLVERMTESRDSDLWSFFDDKADATDFTEKSSEESEDLSGCEDSGVGPSRSKPRRIQTFHGTSQPEGPSGSDFKNGVRRHTTVPRMHGESGSTSLSRSLVDDAGDEEEVTRPRGESHVDRRQYQEMVASLPLRQSLKARRASTKLIKEIISLRKDNHILRSDNAMTKSRCYLLERSRGGGSVSVNPAAGAVDESMETLRKKEKEIRELQHQMISEREELDKKQAALDRYELEMQSKWECMQVQLKEQKAAVHVRTPSANAAISSPTYKTVPQSSQNIEWSPVLANLATKTEMKKKK